jgi:hypothetical protein
MEKESTKLAASGIKRALLLLRGAVVNEGPSFVINDVEERGGHILPS